MKFNEPGFDQNPLKNLKISPDNILLVSKEKFLNYLKVAKICLVFKKVDPSEI